MFVKVFKQILDSSLMEADPHTRLLFFYLMVIADDEGVVDMTEEVLARRCNLPLETVKKAIQDLTSPDLKSRTPELEGRRIVQLEGRSWGWRVVNSEKYRAIQTEAERREHRRKYQQEYYLRRKAKTAAQVQEAAAEESPQQISTLSTVENFEGVEIQHSQQDSTPSTFSTFENVESVESQHPQQASTFSTPPKKKRKNQKKREKHAREVALIFEDPRLRSVSAECRPPPHVARQWLDKLGSRESLVSFLVNLQAKGKLKRWPYVNTIVSEDARREDSLEARPIFLDQMRTEVERRAN